MITRLRAENFKSWKDTSEIRLAPLTGFFGTNSSGKSSLLQILLMLKQTVDSRDAAKVLNTGFDDKRASVDLGPFRQIIHNHQDETALTLSLSWDLPETLAIPIPEGRVVRSNFPMSARAHLLQSKSLSFSTSISAPTLTPMVDVFQYDFTGCAFGMERIPDSDRKDGSYKLIRNFPEGLEDEAEELPQSLPAPLSCWGFPREAVSFFSRTDFLPEFEIALSNVFKQITYLGPLRDYFHRYHTWDEYHPMDVGQRGEYTIAALLAARHKASKIDEKPIEERILDWMRNLGLLESFLLQPIEKNGEGYVYEILVKVSQSSPFIPLKDVGFGVSQILPVLVLCYYAPEGSIILLEHPEMHLHPSVQAGLADVLIDVVKERHVQIIVESHSEHLLHRLQRRVAEGKFSGDQTALYFCSIDNGVSSLETLKMDDFGNITNWPEDFFGDSMGDLIAMTEAEMKRRKESDV